MAYAAQDKETTAVFFESGRSTKEKPVYRRAGFNLVSYDGDPDRYIEPRNAAVQLDTLGTTYVVFSTPATAERIVDFQFYTGHPYETQCFSPEYRDLS